MSSVRRRLLAVVALVLLGCSADPDQEAVTAAQSELFLDANATPWPGGQVRVCWFENDETLPNFKVMWRKIRNLANTSWPAVSGVLFTGWDRCDQMGNYVQVVLQPGQGGGTLGFGVGRYSIFLGMDDPRFTDGSMGAHELGHALGFAHEMNREDFTGECSDPNKIAGNTLDTGPDRNTIMALGYCNDNRTLSNWDAVGARKLYGTRVPAFFPLTTWFDTNSGWATGGAPSFRSSLRSSYKPKAENGWVFANQVVGTVPLKRYTKGLQTISTPNRAAQTAAVNDGWTFVATEGYVHTQKWEGQIPLQTWKESSTGRLLTTTRQSPTLGWSLVRTEGYIFGDRPFDLVWLMWNGTRGDNLSSSQNSTVVARGDASGYSFVGFDGAISRYGVKGMVPLKSYYHAGRGDYFLTATVAGENSAVAAGYDFMRNEGYVYPDSQPGTVAMKSYWNGGTEDNFTTLTIGHPGGYILVRTEGYGFGL
jgi:hypothetical protein